MTTRNSILAVAAAIGACSAAASAAIIPSWRVNSIPAALTGAGQPLNSAISVSLLVTLIGESRFSSAALDLSVLGAGVMYYNDAAGGNGRPNSLFFPVFPTVEFDTYVCASDGSNATNATRTDGLGPATLGPTAFDVAWSAIPPSGPLGGANLEIARITMFGLNPAGVYPIPIENGRVRDQLSATDVALPPLVVPEPVGVVCVCMAAMFFQRRGA